jgi:hypothetical protein
VTAIARAVAPPGVADRIAARIAAINGARVSGEFDAQGAALI